MKTFYCFTFVYAHLYLMPQLSAQVPEIEWQNTIGGSDYDYVRSVQQTADGGYILGGYSYSGVSGDKTEASLGFADYWVIKLNSKGSIQWQNTIGGSSDDFLISIQQTADGGYILGGYSYSDISGDKNEASLGFADYWVIKLNSTGTVEWQNTIGGGSDDYLISIQQTTDGGYILGGYSYSGISGDKTEASLGNYDYWVIKLKGTGAIEWQNTIGGSDYDVLHSIQQTTDEGYILGGYSYSGISGDKTEASLGGGDYWVIKLNSKGAIKWQNTIGGSSNDILLSIKQRTEGGYILGGSSYSGISGDKTEPLVGGSDYWVIKVNNTGAIEWQNTIGGSSYDWLYSIQQTSDDGYILGGYSWSGNSGDKTEAKVGGYDYWVIKLNSAGVIEWQNTIGGTGDDFLHTIQQTADEGYIVGGYSDSGISGDKTEPNTGGTFKHDYWVVKLYTECLITSTITPSGPTEFCEPGRLTLNAPVNAGYSYQWKRNGVNIPGATSADFNASESGNYQVHISNGTCSDISDSILVTATPKPDAVINNLDGTNNLCFDSSIKLKTTTGAGYTYQWGKDGAIISSATSLTYFATAEGIYIVEVTNIMGCNSSASYEIIETCRLGQEMLSDEIIIYPNPNAGEFTIQVPEINPQEINLIQIKNMLGEEVYSVIYSANESNQSINLGSTVAEGLYFFEICTSNSIITKQFIIHR